MMIPPDPTAIAHLAGTFNSQAFWRGCIAARSVGDAQQHDEGIARLRALRDMTESGADVTESPEFRRWLAY